MTDTTEQENNASTSANVGVDPVVMNQREKNMKCECTIGQKMVGDGCIKCNPEYLFDNLLDELADLAECDHEVYARCLASAAAFARNGRRKLAIKLRDAVDDSMRRTNPPRQIISMRAKYNNLDRYKRELMR